MLILTGAAFFIIALLSLASSSIANECYNSEERGVDLKAKKQPYVLFLTYYYKFAISLLSFGVISIILGYYLRI